MPLPPINCFVSKLVCLASNTTSLPDEEDFRHAVRIRRAARASQGLRKQLLANCDCKMSSHSAPLQAVSRAIGPSDKKLPAGRIWLGTNQSRSLFTIQRILMAYLPAAQDQIQNLSNRRRRSIGASLWSRSTGQRLKSLMEAPLIHGAQAIQQARLLSSGGNCWQSRRQLNNQPNKCSYGT